MMRSVEWKPDVAPERVLVVDDDGPLADSIFRWLEREGFECRVGHSVDRTPRVS